MKATVCCAWMSYCAGVFWPNEYQWAANTTIDREHARSRQTGARTTHAVSPGVLDNDVSSCCHCNAPAKPYFASIATPFCSMLRDAHPSTCWIVAGEAHTVLH